MEVEDEMEFEVPEESGLPQDPDPAAQPDEIPCAACHRPRHGKKRWCLIHNRGADCLMRQAARDDKTNKTTHEVPHMKRKLNDPTEGPLKVCQWVADNPEGRPGKKRGGLENTTFQQTTGATSKAGEQIMGKRMDIIEYIRYMERKRGWAAERAQAEWDRMKAIPEWPRDWQGTEPKFPLRLVIPKGDYVYAGQELFNGRALLEASRT
eukprot:6467849-Alexandrium_andersonii.AAC.1